MARVRHTAWLQDLAPHRFPARSACGNWGCVDLFHRKRHLQSEYTVVGESEGDEVESEGVVGGCFEGEESGADYAGAVAGESG